MPARWSEVYIYITITYMYVMVICFSSDCADFFFGRVFGLTNPDKNARHFYAEMHPFSTRMSSISCFHFPAKVYESEDLIQKC